MILLAREGPVALPAPKPPDVPLTLAHIDPNDERQMDAWDAQEEALADERVRAAVADLKARGILDAQGRRVNKDLPPDMREGSKTDLTT